MTPWKKQILSMSLVGVLGIAGATLLPVGYAHGQAKVDSSQLATVQDLSHVFRQIGKQIEPSVVNIKVHKTVELPAHRMPQFQDPFFRRFFDQNGDGEPDIPGFEDVPRGEQIGTGSGVVMDVDGKTGYIVTNNHVADSADGIEITLNDGRIITNGKVVGTDPKTDIAVVKIEADNLVAAKWGNSDELDKGDWVLAFGSPFGYVGSMTHGIISAMNRTNLGIIPQGYESFIQVDAPINPGNSGGPLVNIRGEVIGINTAIASRSGGFQGIGFAIPSNQAKSIYTSLRTKGKVVRGWLGVSIGSVSDPEISPIARSFGYEGKTGVLVQQTFKDTPAFGILHNGDIVTRLNGKDVADVTQLRTQIALMAPGTEVTLDLFRDGKNIAVKIKLGDQPENLLAAGKGSTTKGDTEQTDTPRIGVRLVDVTPELANRFGLKADARGSLVIGVEQNSAALRAGIRAGDLITKINNTDVADTREAYTAIRNADLKKGVRLYIVNHDMARFVFIQVSEPDKKK